MTLFLHEVLYRTEGLVGRIRRLPVVICGAGAIGANIGESLARSGFTRLTLIDRDRVEERNLSTQPYYRADIGAWKATMLANILYRAVGVRADARAMEFTRGNGRKLIAGAGLVIDTFDNSGSRRAVAELCAEEGIPCLHVGLAGGYAEVIWNDIYRVPSPAQDDICDYPLARNLVMLAVAVACETIVGFVRDGEQRSHTITLDDLAVRAFAM